MKINKEEELIYRKWLIVFFVISFLYLPFSYSIPLTGDELYYYKTSALFESLFLALIEFDFAQSKKILGAIISRGLYIPTTSLLIFPLVKISSSITALRLYMFVISLGFNYLIIRKINRAFKPIYYKTYIAFSLFTPIYMIIGTTLWGESIAGKLFVLLFIQLYSLKKDGNKWISYAIILSGIIFFRHSYILILIVTPFLLHHLNKQKGFRFLFLKPTLLTLTFLMLWSVPLSLKFDGPLLTTTTSQTSWVFLYSSDAFKENVSSEMGVEYFKWDILYDYYLTKDLNKGFYDKVKKDRNKIWKDLSMEDYFQKMSNNIKNVVFNQSSFIHRFRDQNRAVGMMKRIWEPVYELFSYAQQLIWVILLPLLFLNPFLILDRKFQTVFLGLIICLIFHPFILKANPRHFYGLYPLLFLNMGLVLNGFKTKDIRFSLPFRFQEEGYVLCSLKIIFLLFLFYGAILCII